MSLLMRYDVKDSAHNYEVFWTKILENEFNHAFRNKVNKTKRKKTDKSWMWDITKEDTLQLFIKSTACGRKECFR